VPNGTGSAGGRRGGRGEGPAQRASRGHVHPLAAARSACARRARRTGAEIELDGDVLERACARGECQLECACLAGLGCWELGGEGGRTAVVGDGERGAQCEWYLDLDLRGGCCCESWRCAGLAC
jgi:hypothetical protein